MITFENGIDSRAREAKKPTVARLNLGGSAGCRYMVIGTNYGYIHTTGGDVRTWKSKSGAYRAARNYVGL
ncbi:hypothetical protein Acf1_00004 [Acidovorax phage ACF1]|nr:hypothetical protein Acf1_00004 [Acidovorax phage ACF1]